jgi:hypothetical protein
VREEHRLRVFENRVLRSVFGPGREEVAGGLKTLHQELHNFYCLQYIFRVIKSRRVRWGWHAAHIR